MIMIVVTNKMNTHATNIVPVNTRAGNPMVEATWFTSTVKLYHVVKTVISMTIGWKETAGMIMLDTATIVVIWIIKNIVHVHLATHPIPVSHMMAMGKVITSTGKQFSAVIATL